MAGDLPIRRCVGLLDSDGYGKTMLHIYMPAKTFAKTFEVDAIGKGESVLVALLPFHHPFDDGLGGVAGASGGSIPDGAGVEIRFAADAEVEQLEQ